MEGKFLIYENWRAENKAVLHKSECGHANEGHTKITNQWLRENPSSNDRWFGYFSTLNEAIAFGALIPNRSLKLCGHCLNNEKAEI